MPIILALRKQTHIEKKEERKKYKTFKNTLRKLCYKNLIYWKHNYHINQVTKYYLFLCSKWLDSKLRCMLRRAN